MSDTFEGTVQFANKAAAPDVRVLLFDKDVRGDDDDLTVQAGRSDSQGRFSVTYSKDRNLDFLDIYLPYLRFEYQINGQPRVHQAFMQPFKTTYQLPETTPVRFIPAEHGLHYVNRYPGYWLPFSIPAIPDIPPINEKDIYGLCGGMVAVSLDFLLHNRPIPRRRRRPGRATPLHQYLHKRQVDSLGRYGNQVVRFVRWMALSDTAVQARTKGEFEKLRESLDDGHPTPIGLVYVGARDTLEIWKNHQVLACDYEMKGQSISIQIYDPNHPRRNDVYILCKPDGQGGLLSEQVVGKKRKKNVRGFFPMPYTPVEPPAHLTVDS